ncbi:MAG TPA: S-formylglutathione hydrolase [Phenylobacterium sp.]|uniref:S-formylglutathione hydrolase n=1 Tax=Phenylobacterium sp. TaxID=1871053 RepID=UPI002B482B9B|nr:S-formylglutathione hydrolase [Phenylobacterium sp.]HKR88959.1 S-formylglutathione hydrolase [Phenylobacterium sp.]
MALETVSTSRSFGGVQGVYRHASAATGTEMTFSVFVPPQAEQEPRPVVTYLSGLTCTHANVTEKGEFRRTAAELGLIVVCPDTSPRGADVPDDEAYDLGQGAGFYLDALQAPWSAHFRMESYIGELSSLIAEHFPADPSRLGIFGHSMGGHGALTLALRHPGRWRSVSAVAPICAPSQVPWGRKAFAAYLGPDESLWRQHDAASLIAAGGRLPPLLVDVGEADPFLERELKPELLEAACEASGQPLTLRRRAAYDHSYYFISTFMAEHLHWHAEQLA